MHLRWKIKMHLLKEEQINYVVEKLKEGIKNSI
jgi:hypothetical protein